MTLRNWLGAVLAVTLVSLSAGQGLADARGQLGRVERAQPARAKAGQIAQPRPGRVDRVQVAPPARAKQVQRLEPRPPAEAARQRGSSNGTNTRAGRANRR